jgi:hypothetical protein
MLNERSDVYSFGILIMEIISGRSPVDYARPAGEVSAVFMIQRSDEITLCAATRNVLLNLPEFLNFLYCCYR